MIYAKEDFPYDIFENNKIAWTKIAKLLETVNPWIILKRINEIEQSILKNNTLNPTIPEQNERISLISQIKKGISQTQKDEFVFGTDYLLDAYDYSHSLQKIKIFKDYTNSFNYEINDAFEEKHYENKILLEKHCSKNIIYLRTPNDIHFMKNIFSKTYFSYLFEKYGYYELFKGEMNENGYFILSFESAKITFFDAIYESFKNGLRHTQILRKNYCYLEYLIIPDIAKNINILKKNNYSISMENIKCNFEKNEFKDITFSLLHDETKTIFSLEDLCITYFYIPIYEYKNKTMEIPSHFS